MNEVGIVINTFDELPLRPTVKIIKTGAVYDLQDVVRYRNLTILGLYAEYETESLLIFEATSISNVYSSVIFKFNSIGWVVIE